MALAGLFRDLPAGLRLALIQASFLSVPLSYARATGLRPLADAGAGPLRARDLLLTALASMASLWILKGLHDVQFDVLRRLGLEESAAREIRGIERTVERAKETAGLAGLAMFAVIPPICEELFFRGLMLRGFARSFSPARAVLYTSLLFAVAHGTQLQVLLMTFLGLYFGALAWLTGSLWPCVLAHAINNAAVLVLQVGWGPRVQEFRAPWPVLVLSVLVLGGVLALMALDRQARRQDLGGGVRPSPEA
jgi:membrane protease YdiL (CAAX protease family)